METYEVLVAVRAEVERGWRHGWGNKSGSVCPMGAIELVTGQQCLGTRAYYALDRALTDGAFSVGEESDKGKSYALALLDRAIAAEAVKASSDPSHVYTLA